MDETNHRSADRHRSAFMVRLPEVLRDKLKRLRERTGKPMTHLLIDAVKALLAKFGMWSKRDEARLEAELGKDT